MRAAFLLVDVFAERPLAGNQLCVVPDGAGLDTATMQAIALEIGFSETTFVLEADAAGYSMRIFTPTAEMPFAGHPSLGTAFVLASLGKIGGTSTQECPAGRFGMEVDLEAGTAWMEQMPPEFARVVDDRTAVAASLRLSPVDLVDDWPVQTVTTGLAHLVVPARSAEIVRRARPDLELVGDVLAASEATGLYLFALEGDGEAIARMFAPDVGVGEDPATGSAAGPLGAYLWARGDRAGRLTVRQGEQIGRPSVLHVEVAAGEPGAVPLVRVGGRVQMVGRGVFEVPDA